MIEINKYSYPIDNLGGMEDSTDLAEIESVLKDADSFDDDSIFYTPSGEEYYIEELEGKWVKVGECGFKVPITTLSPDEIQDNSHSNLED